MKPPEDGWDNPDPVKVKALQCAVQFCKGETDHVTCIAVTKEFETYLRSNPIGVLDTPATGETTEGALPI